MRSQAPNWNPKPGTVQPTVTETTQPETQTQQHTHRLRQRHNNRTGRAPKNFPPLTLRKHRPNQLPAKLEVTKSQGRLPGPPVGPAVDRCRRGVGIARRQ